MLKVLPYKDFKDSKVLNTKNALFATQIKSKKMVNKIIGSVINVTFVTSVLAAVRVSILTNYGSATQGASRRSGSSQSTTIAAVKPSAAIWAK